MMTDLAAEAELRKLPLESLASSPFNVRSIRTPERIAEVAQSLAADGQREAITVYPGTGADAGKYLIVSGVTRYLAAQSLGWEALTARVDASLDPTNALALVRVSRTHNDTVRETDLDHAHLARELLAAKHSAVKVAEALGRSRQDVDRLKTYFKLPPSILELAKTKPEKFSASFAELLKKAVHALGEHRALAVLKQVFAHDLSLREAASLIGEKEERPVRAPQVWHLEKKTLNLAGKEIGEKTVSVAPSGEKKTRLLLTLDDTLSEDLNAELDALLERFLTAAKGEEDA